MRPMLVKVKTMGRGTSARMPGVSWRMLRRLLLAGILIVPFMAVILPSAVALELSTGLMPLSEASAAGKVAAVPREKPDGKDTDSDDAGGLSPTFGVGEAVNLQVYGRPELSTTLYVASDGTISVPLAGKVQIEGLQPAVAAQRVAEAFRKGKLLLDPQVTLSPALVREQKVSVLGAVRTPGRFPIESKTTVLDVIAQAGGTTEGGADVVFLLRPDSSGKINRRPVDLKGLGQTNASMSTLVLRGGDSIYVPVADQFFLNGEIKLPNAYRLEPGMRVVQAIARGGGVTPRGSSRRIEITRRKADGSYTTHDGELNDVIQANDVIRIKERLF